MSILATTHVSLMVFLHVYILVLEMFLWDTPKGHKTFRLKPAYATSTKVLAANQGLYNGFLAAGLGWSLVHPDPAFGKQIALFFLGCMVVAGAFGGATVGKKILFVQCVPAVISTVVVLFL